MNEIRLLPQYREISNPTRYTVITGGRGSAKSWHVALYLLNLTYQPDHVILFTRWTMTSAHISIIPEFIEKIELLNKEDDFEVLRTEITNLKTGSKILFRGIKTSQGTATANLKSIQGVTTLVVDEAEELTQEDVFDKIDLSIRSTKQRNRVILVMNPSYRSHWIYTRFIEPKPPEVTHIHTDYRANAHNLSESFIEQADRVRDSNPLRYQHLFLGAWLDDAEGLMWTRAMLTRQRIKQPPQMERVLVAIDPAGTKTMTSDETGIVVVGKSGEHGYLLEDLSGKYSPLEWATVAKQAADKWKAAAIVAEKNMGHDLVAAMIQQVAPQHRVILVNATKGKAVRAEPIFGLYEQGRIWHVGEFPQLEAQMVTFNPDAGGASPDRVDALVWGFTELLMKKQIKFQIA
jgi:PBSX family phage terminase large subunit